MEDKSNRLVKISFADDKLPVYKEVSGQDFILNGEQNNYPDHLIDLFNRSGKHNAIVTGVADMIVGGGVKAKTPAIQSFLDAPNDFETFDDINAKVALDLKLFGGFYLQMVWDRAGKKVVKMFHMPYREMRVNKEGTEFYRNKKWGQFTKKWEAKFNAFNPTTIKEGEPQIFYYKEYRPDLEFYPLPDYIGVRQYIETDTEISNFHYNNIKNSFSDSTIITFFNGMPTEEEQKVIVRKLKNKKTGTDNAGGLTVNFATKKDEAPEVIRLTPDEMDKQYLQLYTTVSDEIFIGHKVTNPSIFGVKVAGQLGSRQDLIDSQELFYTNYISKKVAILERAYNYLLNFVVNGAQVYIEKGNSQDSKSTDIHAQPAQPTALASNQKSESDILMLFDSCGEPEADYRIIKTKRLRFGDEVENEEKFKADFLYDFDFAEPLNITIDDTQAKVLEVIKQNPKMSIADIANLAKTSADDTNKAIQYLIDEGVLKANAKDGTIEITDRGLKTIDEKAIIGTEIFVKYKYTGPKDDKNRSFCRQVLDKARLYTREDIDMVSDKAGYNVWTQRGGWYHTPEGVNTPYCRHFWNQVIVQKKVRK